MVEEINALKMSKEVVQQLRTLGREVTCPHGYNTCCGVYLLTNEALLEILFSKVESLEYKPSGAGDPVDLDKITAALNASAQRCDGCARWIPQGGRHPAHQGQCEEFGGAWTDDGEFCSRWAPRYELKGDT